MRRPTIGPVALIARLTRLGLEVAMICSREMDGDAFESSEALVESMLGRQLIPGEEYALITADRRWLTQNDCVVS